MYAGDPSPGVVLADEVGMGKTYEVFAVVAALFRHVPKARVTVLTHSSQMATTWAERWSEFRKRTVRHLVLPEGRQLGEPEAIGTGSLEFASYNAIKHVENHALHFALDQCFKGRWLRRKDHTRLRKALLNIPLGTWVNPTLHFSRGALDSFWKNNYAADKRTWRSAEGARNHLRRLVYHANRTKRHIDLLVVDEAHKTARNKVNCSLRRCLPVGLAELCM